MHDAYDFLSKHKREFSFTWIYIVYWKLKAEGFNLEQKS